MLNLIQGEDGRDAPAARRAAGASRYVCGLMPGVGRGRLDPARRCSPLAGGCQSGQSLILFALMLLALVAGTGLVIDTGFAFDQRRLAQNAADGAALAATQYLAQNRSSDVPCATVSAIIQQYVSANLPGSTFAGSYLGPGATTWDTVTDQTCVIPHVQTRQNPTVVGVALAVSHTGSTFFLRVLNLSTVTVQARATAEYGGVWRTPVQNVLPIILDDQEWADATGQSGNWGVTPQSVMGCPLGFWNGPSGTGSAAELSYSLDITNPIDCGLNGTPKVAGFDWGPLNLTCNQSTGQCSNSDSVIKCLMQTSCIQSNYAGATVGVGDYVQVSGGVRDTNFFNYLAAYAAGKDMIVPLVSHADLIANNCPNCAVKVVGLVWIHIVQSYANGSNSYFLAGWDDPNVMPTIPGNQVNFNNPSYQVISWGLVK